MRDCCPRLPQHTARALVSAKALFYARRCGRFVNRPYGFCFIADENRRADDIRPYGSPASQSLPDRANEFKSVFPATCASEKLPEAKRHASPRADQPSIARAMEREYSNKEPGLSRALCLRPSGLRAGGDEGFARFVAFVLVEVLHEALRQILRLGVPLGGVGVGVARVEDRGIDAGQLGGHLEVEQRDLLGRSLEHVAVQDRVDDAAGVLDGDALAGAVPAGVDEIRLRAGLLHALDELLGVGSVMPRSVPASLAVKPERK